MKKNKKTFIATLIILVCVLFAACFLVNKPETQQINSIDVSLIDDGVYTGECDNKLVKAGVEVQVEDGRITNIKILEHENGLGSKAETIVNRVIQGQTLNVDAVTGATYSSNTILKAIENALHQGEKEVNL